MTLLVESYTGKGASRGSFQHRLQSENTRLQPSSFSQTVQEPRSNRSHQGETVLEGPPFLGRLREGKILHGRRMGAGE